MPLAINYSMVFMNFMMPILLITLINSMDEIRRLIARKSTKMQLKGLESLFPKMAKNYVRYVLSEDQKNALICAYYEARGEDSDYANLCRHMDNLTQCAALESESADTIDEGMVFVVKRVNVFLWTVFYCTGEYFSRFLHLRW